jgi:hypothetical protein
MAFWSLKYWSDTYFKWLNLAAGGGGGEGGSGTGDLGVGNPLEGDTLNVNLLTVFDVPSNVVSAFTLQSGSFPENLQIVQDTPTFTLSGLLSYMDSYVVEFAQPDGFSYDSSTQAGAGYASYGAGLAGSKIFEFVIRCTFSEPYEGFDYKELTFQLEVETNYSTMRDNYILTQFANKTIEFQGVKYTAQGYINKMKELGYYA